VDTIPEISQDAAIHPLLAGTRLGSILDTGAPVRTGAELRAVTAEMIGTMAAPLWDLVRYGPARRWWTRLALTPEVEVWLLSWLPGQGTAPHDHGGAAGSFAVLSGDLSETYRYPGRPVRRATRGPGTAIGFGPGHAHVLRNSSEAPAVSVHAYSPPLVPTREYESLYHIPDEIPSLTVFAS
jgi:predicted metal-dependent enzyme (double-stranded beta helix superfamily)